MRYVARWHGTLTAKDPFANKCREVIFKKIQIYLLPTGKDSIMGISGEGNVCRIVFPS